MCRMSLSTTVSYVENFCETNAKPGEGLYYSRFGFYIKKSNEINRYPQYNVYGFLCLVVLGIVLTGYARSLTK